MAQPSRRLSFLLVLLLALLMLPVHLGIVRGTSMKPTLNPGSAFFFTRLRPTDPISMGDIVVVHLGGQTCIKRVASVGEDHIYGILPIRDRNDPPLELVQAERIQSWKKRYPFLPVRSIEIPRGWVYVVGDGMSSLDSRQLGPVPRDAVLGRVVFPSRDATFQVPYAPLPERAGGRRSHALPITTSSSEDGLL